MHTNFVPLPARSVSAHSYVVESFSPIAEEAYLNSTNTLSIRLHQACLMTQETVQPYFKRDKLLFGKDSQYLSRQRVSPQSKWMSSRLIHLADKAAAATSKTLVRFIKKYRLQDNLQASWRNLKENFSQFYLKLMKDREIRNKVENKT
jgi:hypothetical protein